VSQRAAQTEADAAAQGRQRTTAPWHCEPDERGQLQGKTDGEGGLMRLDGIAAVGLRPLPDDEAGERLQTARRAHVDDAEGGIGAAYDLLGEIARQDCKAEQSYAAEHAA
jgi:hypothetical protein